MGAYGCFMVFPKIWENPQIMHFKRVFPYKPSFLGYRYFWKHPYIPWKMKQNGGLEIMASGFMFDGFCQQQFVRMHPSSVMVPWENDYIHLYSYSNLNKVNSLSIYYRRKFRSLTSDNMDSWKSSAARKKINRCGKKEDQQARNVREVAKCCVFQCFVCRLGRKVTSLKRLVRRWLLREDMKNCTPLWREAHLQVKMYKTQHSRTTFWSCDVEKLHAAVARSTFSSQNVQNTAFSDHFLKLRCGKIARRCGEKHIFKSKS